MKLIDISATKLSNKKKSIPPKGSKLKVKGYRPPLHLLECPWAQCSDYNEESSYRSAFRTFKVIQRTKMIRPTEHIMRDKESLQRSVFLRRQFGKKKEYSENCCGTVNTEKCP